MSRERTRYFAGQLIGVADLERDQLYFREKARRHNRLLHGWGIVRGLDVTEGPPGTCEVKISPGYALDRRGEEVVLEAEATIDLSGHALGEPLYVAARYDERLERPVPAGDRQEYTRVRETCALEVLVGPPSGREPLVLLAEVVLRQGPAIGRIVHTHRRRLAV